MYISSISDVVSNHSYGIVVRPNNHDLCDCFLDQMIVIGENIPREVKRTYQVGSFAQYISIIIIESTMTGQINNLNINDIEYFTSEPSPRAYHCICLELDKKYQQRPVIEMTFKDPNGFPSGSNVEITLLIDYCGRITLGAKSDASDYQQEATYGFNPSVENDRYPSIGVGMHSFGESGEDLMCMNIRKKGATFPAEKSLTLYTSHPEMSFIKLPIYTSESQESVWLIKDQAPRFNACIPLPDRIPAGTPVCLKFRITEDGDFSVNAEIEKRDQVTIIYHHALKETEIKTIELDPCLPFVEERYLFTSKKRIVRDERASFTSKKSTNGIIYGIDLGTTYSCIARINPGTGLLEVNKDQGTDSTTLASAVYFDKGEEYIGDDAKEFAALDRKRPCEFFKRYIGRVDLAEADKDKDDGPYYMFEGIDGRQYTPVELSSKILAKLVDYTEKCGMGEVKNVVISCPTYFDSAQRDATRRAGEVIGLNVISIVNEPTAAAVNYYHDKLNEEQTILVYDLGGATFDLSIIRRTFMDGIPSFDIIDVDGDDRLGGKDWDARLFDIVKKKLEEEYEMSIQEDSDIAYELRSKIEKAKMDLSKPKAEAKVTTEDGDRIIVTRKEFEDKTADLVKKTIEYVDRIISDNGLTVDTFDKILLVGGSTRMPMIQEALKEKFGAEKIILHEPTVAVAKGAAVLANANYNC